MTRDSDPFDDTIAPDAHGGAPGLAYGLTQVTEASESGEELEFDPDRSLRGTPNRPGAQETWDLPLISIEEPGERTPALGVPRARPEVGGPGPDLQLVELLGQGGMGQVWLARQRSLLREVAVKCLRPGRHEDRARAALLHEGAVMGNLQHPNIVPVHALGRDATRRPVLVMERVRGVPWSELLHDPDHPGWPKSLRHLELLARNLEVLRDICNALDYAHDQGVLHRDIKPANVMLGAFGEVYLLDWGLAMRLSDASGRSPSSERPAVARIAGGVSTVRGRLVGTPSYMAPEMIEGDPSRIDPRTDVYLLGATLFEIITGRPPHQGRSLPEVLASAERSKPPIPEETDAPGALIEICLKALSVEPADRYPSVRAFADAMDWMLLRRASMRLVEAAAEHLARVEALSEEADAERVDAELREAATACQFGCMQALREWPENPQAERVLSHVRELLCAHELDMGHARAAAALLEGLDAPPPELRERLEALRESQARNAADVEALRELRRDLNFDAAAPRRRIGVWLALGVAVLLIVPALQPLLLSLPQLIALFCVDILALSVVGVALVVQRKTLLARRINRQFFTPLPMILGTSAVLRLVAHHQGLDVSQTIAMEMIINAAICFTSTLLVPIGFGVIGVVMLAGLVATLLMPERAHEIHVITGLSIWIFVLVHLRTSLRAAHPDS